MHPPILGKLAPGKTQRHMIKLPGAAFAKDEPRPVISITGATPGPLLFVNAGVHGGEYPAIEAVIRLSNSLDPKKIAGTLILMPVMNLPAFRARTPFVCPIDNVNPNRVFPGDPAGSYSEQMTHALINEFVVHADAYVDLHGGDIPEALVPFVICRSEAGLADSQARDVARRSKEMALAFGLPYVLAVSKPVQPSKGQSSYAAAADKGIPAILAEAGGVGQMQEDAVDLLFRGVINVMRHLGMVESVADATATENDEAPAYVELRRGRRMTNAEANPKSKIQKTARSAVATTVLTKFEWLYTKQAGMWYPKVAA
ncbi:MAG: succinylglutamate desuccinylase/aspartoacylase family protein, partial [Verrucomicrobia bacterium]|nr:succinylglutamate desuccinylase/aspartoacylase family protein [Verrucomicrobiota bacterium]